MNQVDQPLKEKLLRETYRHQQNQKEMEEKFQKAIIQKEDHKKHFLEQHNTIINRQLQLLNQEKKSSYQVAKELDPAIIEERAINYYLKDKEEALSKK